ncbi:MAG TPA: N-acetyltransferase, partial [Deltaproteobacteria bacterium]|nr:N-acetyltransferase [Deltaproteobacteria bacterium]
MSGKWCRVEILDPEKHAEELFAAYVKKRNDQDWTYLPYGPFDSFENYQEWLKTTRSGDDPLFHAIVTENSQKAIGVASFLRTRSDIGVLEVGHIHFSPLLQKTPVATEAMFLMMSRVFDELGYRRYEWKCDALNTPSRKAVQRLGFIY